MNIRPMTRADLDAVVALLADDGLGRGRETPGDPAYADAFARMEATPGNLYLVAEQAGHVVGCLQLTMIHGLSRRGASRAQIEGVRVAANCRGQRIGERLFEAAFERARGAGCGLVQLTSDKTRQDAHRFYERLGFVASHTGFKRDL